MDILNILANKNRRKILKLLLNKDMHITAIAKELEISAPVTLKHLNILESAELIKKEYIGKSAVIKIRDDAIDVLKKIEDIYEKPKVIKAKKGETIKDVLSRTEWFDFEVSEKNGEYFIKSIDGTEGYFIFLANGKKCDKSISNYKINKETVLEFQRLVPVIGKKIRITIE